VLTYLAENELNLKKFLSTKSRNKSMKHVIGLKMFFMLFLMQGSAIAQEKKTVDLSQSIDYATFAAESGQTSIELYIALPKSLLTYSKQNDTLFITELTVQLIALKNGKKEKQSELKVISKANSLKDKNGLIIITLSQVLPVGEYEFVINVSESDGNLKADTHFNIALPNYTSDSLKISDIELASAIDKSENKQSPFYKNTLEVIPQPTTIFGGTINVLSVYAELYNLARNQIIDSRAVFQRTYLTRNGKVIAETERKKSRRRTNDATVFIEKLPLDSLVSGNYEYHLELCDSTFSVIVQKSKKFYVYNPQIKTERMASAPEELTNSEFATMTEEALDELREQIETIILPEERDRYNSNSTLEKKRLFFEQFWKTRGGISAWRQYMNVIQSVNQQFSTGSKKGYKTDKGKIFIKYGKPSSIERSNEGAESKPYEVWSYENIKSQGLVTFIFADRNGYGSYDLLHSTMPGEMSNANWQQLLRATSR
jgi:GWxTD domain-containing protein